MVTQAPVITKGAVPPPVQGGGRPMSPEELEQAKRERAERERVIAAVNFGAALQDLVVHARLEKNGPDAAPRRLNSAQFPPDLFYRINPETLLRNTCHKLLKLEETLLRLLSLEETLLRPEQHDETRQRQQQGHQGWQRQQVQQGQQQEQQPEEMGQQRQQQEQRSEETGQGRQESEETGQGRQEQKRQEQQEEQRPEEVGQPRQQGQQRPEETGQQRQQQRQQGQQRRQGASGGAGQTFGRAGGAPPASSAQIMIKQKVEQLITYARRNPHAELESYLSQHDGVDATICEWDALIVERIVDFPAVFAGYRTGKALSMTRWKIWEAKRWNSVDGNPYIDTWKEAFSKKRIGEIKRQVSSLGTVLDPQAVAVVTTSLGYWREALLTLTLNKESSKARGRARWRRMLQSIATFRESSKVQSTQPSEIEISPEHGQRLQSALDEQITSWLDLLTQRRPLESFPVVGIVTALTKKMAAAWWKKLMRYAIIIGVGLAVVLILGTLIAVGIMVYNDIRIGNTSLNWEELLTSIGTAFAAIFTFIVVQGRSLFDRSGGEDPKEMRPGGGRLGGYGTGGFMNMFWRGSYGIRGSTGGPGLKQNALSNVVEQIQLEEYNLAVSDPLVRCFLTLTDQESTKGDPKEEAERFLRSVYGDRSNLDRLLPTFKDLYKH